MAEPGAPSRERDGGLFTGLRGRLLAIAATGILVAIGFLVYGASEQRRLARAVALERAGATVGRATSEYGRHIAVARDLLSVLATHPAVRAREPRAASRAFAELIFDRRLYANIGSALEGGRIYASALPMKRAYSVAERSWFRKAKETRAFAVGDFQVGQITGRRSLNVGLPVLAPSGAVRQVLFAALDLDELSSSLVRVELPESSILIAFDANGTVLMRHPQPERWIGRSAADTTLFRRARATPRGTTETEGLDGVVRLFAHDTLRGATPAGDLIVAVGIPRTAAFREADAVFRTAFIGILLAALISLPLAMWLSARFVVRPVRSLAEAAGRITRGDLSARSGVPHADHELGRFARAFDEMAEHLERTIGERERAEAQLRQAQKMEALGALAGGVAHDFNNLLTVILGWVDEIDATSPPDHEVRAATTEIRRAAERAAALTRQLLAFSRRQVMEIQPLDVNAAIEGVARMLRRTLGEHVRLEFELAPGLPPILGDAGSLEQVLLNLSVNARDAMPSGGTLRFSTDLLQPGRGLGADAGHMPLRVRIAVADTGTGMPAEVCERIFEPFFTTKPKGKGTGIGLAMAYGIVRQMRGEIEVSSVVGEGTTFRIALPAANGALPEPREPDARVSSRGRGERTLLVEDDDALREYVLRALSIRGFAARSEGDPRAALERLRAEPDRFDALVTDIVMPGIDGLALARAVRAIRPDIPVIFMTGYSEQVDAAIEFPHAHVLQKPFAGDALADALRRLLDAPRA